MIHGYVDLINFLFQIFESEPLHVSNLWADRKNIFYIVFLAVQTFITGKNLTLTFAFASAKPSPVKDMVTNFLVLQKHLGTNYVVQLAKSGPGLELFLL